jgi:hypothetical protein
MIVVAKNSTKTNRAGIYNYGARFVGVVEIQENGVTGEEMLQLIKSVLMLGCPCPGLIGLGKRKEVSARKLSCVVGDYFAGQCSRKITSNMLHLTSLVAMYFK